MIVSLLRGRRTVGVLGASALWLAGSAAHAAQVCALGRIAIVESRRGDCHAIRAIVLDPKGMPAAAGAVCLTKSAALHQLTRQGDHIVAQLWNAIEIYSFADPRAPRLVRSFTLDETHPSWGGGGIVHEGDRLLVLGTTVSAELEMAGPPRRGASGTSSPPPSCGAAPRASTTRRRARRIRPSSSRFAAASSRSRAESSRCSGARPGRAPACSDTGSTSGRWSPGRRCRSTCTTRPSTERRKRPRARRGPDLTLLL